MQVISAPDFHVEGNPQDVVTQARVGNVVPRTTPSQG